MTVISTSDTYNWHTGEYYKSKTTTRTKSNSYIFRRIKSVNRWRRLFLSIKKQKYYLSYKIKVTYPSLGYIYK